jgi:hypothetical protein
MRSVWNPHVACDSCEKEKKSGRFRARVSRCSARRSPAAEDRVSTLLQDQSFASIEPILPLTIYVSDTKIAIEKSRSRKSK